jgi:hypothetical protein
MIYYDSLVKHIFPSTRDTRPRSNRKLLNVTLLRQIFSLKSIEVMEQVITHSKNEIYINCRPIHSSTNITLFTAVVPHKNRFMHQTVSKERNNSGCVDHLLIFVKPLPINETVVDIECFCCITAFMIVYQLDQRRRKETLMKRF